MGEGMKKLRPGAGTTEGNRRPTGAAPILGVTTSGLAPGQRWSLARKREVVLRLLRGESVDAISANLGYRPWLRIMKDLR
jgi:hypothetical protein